MTASAVAAGHVHTLIATVYENVDGLRATAATTIDDTTNGASTSTTNTWDSEAGRRRC